MTRYGAKYVRKSGQRSTYDAVFDTDKGSVTLSHYLPADLCTGLRDALDGEERVMKIVLPIEEFVFLAQWLSNVADCKEEPLNQRQLWMPTGGAGYPEVLETREQARKRNSGRFIGLKSGWRWAVMDELGDIVEWDFVGDIAIHRELWSRLGLSSEPKYGDTFEFEGRMMTVTCQWTDDYDDRIYAAVLEPANAMS